MRRLDDTKTSTGPKIVLLDRELCDEASTAALAARKASEGAAAPRIVLVSAPGNPLPPASIAALDPVTTLAKPVRPSQLAEWAHELSQTSDSDPRWREEKADASPSTDASADGIQPLKVLVAEDNRVNQIVARKSLERLGCHVEMAWNGTEAVQLAAIQRFDIILMDCQMPEMDGFEATRKIRAAAEGPNASTPIVAVTANAMADVGERCLQAGMQDHLSKPFLPRDLTELLARMVPGQDRLAS